MAVVILIKLLSIVHTVEVAKCYKSYSPLKSLWKPVDTGDKNTCHMTNAMHCGAAEEIFFDGSLYILFESYRQADTPNSPSTSTRRRVSQSSSWPALVERTMQGQLNKQIGHQGHP